jgi:hypothetical protein
MHCRKISSVRDDIGDPILCRVTRLVMFGQQVLPYGSYLGGTFQKAKDPGYLVGKGWMVLSFDRIVLPQGEIIPIQGKVVDVPQYVVDKQGRILGRGHATRDVVLWAIPILWPIDLLNLPRRGPKPTLRPETNITVKLMDDLMLPTITVQQQSLPPAPMPATEYQPPALRTRPPAQNYQYQQQSYPAYPYRNPPPPYYSYPRVGAFAFVARVARYYPHTFDRQ